MNIILDGLGLHSGPDAKGDSYPVVDWQERCFKAELCLVNTSSQGKASVLQSTPRTQQRRKYSFEGPTKQWMREAKRQAELR